MCMYVCMCMYRYVPILPALCASFVKRNIESVDVTKVVRRAENKHLQVLYGETYTSILSSQRYVLV